MQTVLRLERVTGWVGTLSLERLGYSWRIKTKVNGKTQTVAQSYYYTTDKQKALDALNYNYNVVTGFQRDLFNL
jgi:hypothetical protein